MAEALAMEKSIQIGGRYHNDVPTELQRGDTVRLLADIDHAAGIDLDRGNNDYSCLGELTTDLNGHKLNVNATEP